jgi:hypothetical protein
LSTQFRLLTAIPNLRKMMKRRGLIYAFMMFWAHFCLRQKRGRLWRPQSAAGETARGFAGRAPPNRVCGVAAVVPPACALRRPGLAIKREARRLVVEARFARLCRQARGRPSYALHLRRFAQSQRLEVCAACRLTVFPGLRTRRPGR